MLIKIGRHTISLWLVFIISGAFCVAAFAAYMTLTIPFTVREPFEILDYPATLNLYPGQTSNFTVTVRNNAPLSYTVFLDFSLDNATYRDRYVTASSEPYIVHPGTQSLAAWLAVSADAPSLNAALGLSCRREAVEAVFSATEQIRMTNMEFTVGSPGSIVVTAQNTGTVTVSISEVWINNVKLASGNLANPASSGYPYAFAANNVTKFAFSYPVTAGFTYQVKLMSMKGNQWFYSATSP